VLRLYRRRGLLDEPTVSNMLTWQAAGGFSIDASVRISGRDRTGRERLRRQPLLAHVMGEGFVVVSDGDELRLQRCTVGLD
jgi:hypothetical protein